MPLACTGWKTKLMRGCVITKLNASRATAALPPLKTRITDPTIPASTHGLKASHNRLNFSLRGDSQEKASLRHIRKLNCFRKLTFVARL